MQRSRRHSQLRESPGFVHLTALTFVSQRVELVMTVDVAIAMLSSQVALNSNSSRQKIPPMSPDQLLQQLRGGRGRGRMSFRHAV